MWENTFWPPGTFIFWLFKKFLCKLRHSPSNWWAISIVSWKTIKIRHALIILNDLENLTYVSGNIKKWNELAKALHVVVLPAICLGIFLLPSAT